MDDQTAQRPASWWSNNQREFAHVLRTTIAAVASLLIARLFRLPESYWAPITTIVITQSSIGAAWAVSKQRLTGTALGAVVGAILATYAPPNALTFTVGILLTGLLCVPLRIDRSAYRFAGITIGIVVLVAHTAPAWRIALNRFIEISIGIGVALLLTVLWPEADPPSA